MSVLLPALGNPSRPTSASSFSSSSSRRSSPGVPSWAKRGVCRVEVAKFMLPSPPRPPRAMTTAWHPGSARSARSSPESWSRISVPDGDAQDEVVGRGPVAVAPHPVLPVPRPVVLLVPVVEQRGQPGVRLEDDRAAVAAVTAGGTAAVDELLPAEGHGAVPAVASLHLDGDLVDELHGGLASLGMVEAGRRPLVGGCAGPLGNARRRGRTGPTPLDQALAAAWG